jgi:hypothetical protein
MFRAFSCLSLAAILALAGAVLTASDAQAYPVHPPVGPAYLPPPVVPAYMPAPYCPPPCAPTKTIVLNVKNPACCGDGACVKVCVPACCEGPPQVCARCGVLGRGIVTYEWCCGHRVTVVFTALGTVRVR